MTNRKLRRDVKFVVSCEHGGNQIPRNWRTLFGDSQDVLNSHRGWDPGALRVAKVLSQKLKSPFFYSETSRLLVELNRSPGHRSLFSEFTASLSDSEKDQILAEHWTPYRNEVTGCLDGLLKRSCKVVHLSVHSFTPVWADKPRRTSIGLLYDPRRSSERLLCNRWKERLRVARPDLVIHSNQPYLGKADGFTTSLRRRYADPDRFRDEYIGVEIEVNQALIHPATIGQITSIADLLYRCLDD